MQILDLPQTLLSKLNVLGLEKLKRFQFGVQIDGMTDQNQVVMGFSSIDGIARSVGVREVQEGGYNGAHKFPGEIIEGPLTLRRGMTFDRSLYNWQNEVHAWRRGQKTYLRTLSIFMLARISEFGQDIPFEVWRFEVFNAWPSEWTGPSLDAMSIELAVESLTIQYEGLSEARGLLSGRIGTLASIFT